MKKITKLIILIIIASLLHETGHVIAGGGFLGFRYAPDKDILTTVVIVPNLNVFTYLAGFMFTLPLLLLRIYPSFLFIFFIIQSRWDFLYTIRLINPYSFDFGWTIQ